MPRDPEDIQRRLEGGRLEGGRLGDLPDRDRRGGRSDVVDRAPPVSVEDGGEGGDLVEDPAASLVLPPPPSSAPLATQANVTARIVQSAARDVARGQTPHSAFKVHGVQFQRGRWEALASSSTDPFWAWAMTCIEMADALCVGLVERALLGKALTDVRAQKFFLERRSPDYMPVQEEAPARAGTDTGAAVDRLIAALERARESGAGDAGAALVQKAWERLPVPEQEPDPDVIEAEEPPPGRKHTLRTRAPVDIESV